MVCTIDVSLVEADGSLRSTDGNDHEGLEGVEPQSFKKEIEQTTEARAER